jgi:HEAT repeat protein
MWKIARHIARLSLMIGVCVAFSSCVILLPFVHTDAGKQSPYSESGSISCSMNMARSLDAVNSSACVQGGSYRGARVGTRTSKQRKLEQLMVQLRNSDAAVRTNAATDIGALGSFASPAIGPLANAARYDESKWVRRASVKSLAKISSEPRVVQTLTAASHDSDKWVAHSAQKALHKMGTK